MNVKKLNESKKTRRNFSKKFLLSYLSAVHEVQQASHVIAVDIGHKKDRMWRWMFDEYLLEVWAAHWENLKMNEKKDSKLKFG